MRRLAALLGVTAGCCTLSGASAAVAATGEASWPPSGGPGHLFVHYGEEHWNDPDGEAVLTKVVADTIRFRPGLVTMSGDKVDDGTAEQLEGWRKIMEAYDRAGIPYMAGVGNHDGKQPTPEAITDLASGSTPLRDITFYKEVFAGRPYPMGDAAPYANPLMAPAARPPDDPLGTSTHYWVDYANVRHIFIDSSCYGIFNCDPLQNPPDGKGRSQYEFLEAAASEADAQGKVVFVVTHMPTRDPRDQRHSTAAQINHVMGKGVSPDNARLEEEAERLGVDAVLVAHIKGQWQYVGRGDIPYYIDGGAGGELYTAGPIGVDHGYWYGFRLLRVDGKRVETDVVPVIAEGGVVVAGPRRLVVGDKPVTFEAFAKQPATKSHRGIVTRLELRDPDPVPRSGGLLALGPLWPAVAWLAPLLVVVALALGRRRRVLALAVAAGGALGLGAVAAAQQSEPTSTPKAALPNPARIFTTENPLVLAPVASDSDDPRRDPASQTTDGRFRAACPGRATLTVTSGWERATLPVEVEAGPGTIVRSIRRGARTVPRGRRTRLATVRVAQPAIVKATLSRGGKRVRTLRHACLPAGAHAISWNGLLRRGRYTLTVRVSSSPRAIVRRYAVTRR
jgi:hypothetical protein